MKDFALKVFLYLLKFKFQMVNLNWILFSFYVKQFPFKFVACLFQFFQWPIVISFEE